MKKIISITTLVLCSIIAFAQENDKRVYFTNPGEIILQFTQTNIKNNSAKNGVRASYFTNLPYYMNINYNNSFGLMPGICIKNIGIKTKNEQIDTITYDKIKRRVFTAGASLAAKYGNFKKCVWFYAGGGIDWAFHYRQKLYTTSGHKNITKSGEWMSEATPTFIPSVFVGIQTPISLNIKATYYFNDFLNQHYRGTLGDFSKITKSQLFTISFSLILKEFPDKNSEGSITPPSRKEQTVEL